MPEQDLAQIMEELRQSVAGAELDLAQPGDVAKKRRRSQESPQIQQLLQRLLQQGQGGGFGAVEDILGQPPTAIPQPLGNLPGAANFRPGGPQINFLGGSPFPVNETPSIVQNGLVLATRLAKAFRDLQQRKTEGGGA